MLDEQQPSAPTPDDATGDDDATFRDIHPLAPGTPPPHAVSAPWDAASHLSLSSEEPFMTMSREFTAMVAAGSTMPPGNTGSGDANQLSSIGEDELEETNPLAIVPDPNPIAAPPARRAPAADAGPVEVQQVKKEEVETKVTAWQTAEVSKINNRFKREEVVINGWENERVEKATARLKKIERKLDEQRAKAVEKAQNDIARARRKGEEKRASADAKRGIKMAKVFELANFMKAVGRVPTRRSFF